MSLISEITHVLITDIVPGDNDRTAAGFKPEEIRELANSIKSEGLINPITIRPVDGGKFEIVEGERRYRAHLLLELTHIPAKVRVLTDIEASDIMLAENTGRKDLDPIDEAKAYQKRIDRYQYTIEQVAKKAGVSMTRVQQRLKLLKLRADIQHLVRYGNFQVGYALIIAEAGLDNNRQTIALKRLETNASPTPQWFRGVCSDLAKDQCQESLFGNSLMLQMQETPKTDGSRIINIPLPATHKPPRKGQTMQEIIQGQITYWNEAAAAWNKLGKNFKKDQCEAAAAALAHLLD